MNKPLFLLLLSIPALSIAQKTDSLEAILRIDSLVERCMVLTEKKQFEEAVLLIKTGEKLAVEQHGRNSAGYATCVFNHGKTLHTWGKTDDAEPFYIVAKEIQEKVLGKEHPDYATSLHQMALLYRDKSEFAHAESLMLEAKNIREKALGKDHPDYASSLNNLGGLYRFKGDLEQSERMYLAARDIRIKVLGKDHPDYARSLNNLANLFFSKGEYTKAAQLNLDMSIRNNTKAQRPIPQTLESASYLGSNLKMAQKALNTRLR
ncbi:MAG: tetratricopeptide repeat-containing protein [Saprospiraceae bacterium]|nr:tetratricopeptide repeat-containing protein [Saprospiraceae bacterium]